MAQNTIDQVYGSRVGVDMAQKMAEALLQPNRYSPTADTLKLGGTWMLGVPDIVRALSGAGYRNIAGSQDATLSDRMVNPSMPNPLNKGYGRIEQPAATRKRKADRVNYDPLALAEGQSPKDLGMETEVAEAPLATGDDFIDRLIQIESGGNPNARTGSYRGLGQFGRAEEKRYGINDSNWNDPNIAVPAIKKHMVWLTEQFKNRMGREPTPGELYLAHQQGAAGAPALLSNPDKPAWQTIRPYYDSDNMAKLAIRGNIPNGHALKQMPVENVMAGDFAKLWTSRFEPKSVNKFAGRMGLGMGVPEGEGEPSAAPSARPMGDQMAQAFPSGGLPGQSRTVSPNQSMQPGGFQGPYPPARPIESDEQLKAILRSLPPEQRAQYFQNYMDRRKPDKYETPGGEMVVTPNPNGPPNYTNIPKGIQTLNIDGVGIPYKLNQDGSIGLMLPGGEKSFKDINELLDWRRTEKSKDTASTKITEGQSDEITNAISVGNKAPQLIKSLDTLDRLSKSSDVPRGPFSKYSVAVRQVIDNLGLTKYLPGIVDADLSKAETIQKINAELARQAVQTFTNRGTNFELETYIQNNPGILQSKEGMEMLIDVIRQEYKGLQEIGKIANSIRPGDIASFNGKVAEYYENNPIVITGPIRDPKTNKIIDKAGKMTTMNVTQDTVHKVPSGYYFMLPDGRIGKKP